jgi:tetratricopeptide (TPR) repeat protein
VVVALGPTLPAFLALLDVSVEARSWQALDPAQRRQRTLEAIKGLLLRESQVQPLLLVFENLHWIDAETQAVLDSLVESLPTARMLLLVNYRPEYQHGWGSKTYYTQLRLDPLSPASAAERLAKHAFRGEVWEKAVTYLRQAGVIADAGAGLVPLCQGDGPQAIPLRERGLQVCQTADRPLLVPRCAAALGRAYPLCGRGAAGLVLLEGAVAQPRAREIGVCHPLWLAYLSEGYRLVGRMAEARGQAMQALECAQAHQGRGHAAWARRLLGAIAAPQAPPELEPAAQYYRQALAPAEELGMRPLVAHCHLGLGTLYAKTGQRQQARAELSTAIAMYRAMEMTFWLPQGEVALAQVEER